MSATMTQAESDAGITFAELGIELRKDFGTDKTHCPRCHGERTNQSDRSLSVNIDAGTFTCHHPGCEWNETSGLGKEARKAGRSPGPAVPNGKENVTRITPIRLPDSRPGWVDDYFEARAIGPTVLARYGVLGMEDRIKGQPAQTIVFPYSVGGRVLNAKYRTVALDGERIDPETGKPVKVFRQAHGSTRTMYGMDHCPADSRAVVIVEGEIEVLSCAEAGWSNVISLPDGAPKHANDSKLKALQHGPVKKLLDQAEIIVIATDADEPGQEAKAALIEVLDPAKCWHVTWPEGCNDANDVLRTLGREALDNLLWDARPADLPGIHDFSEDFEDALQIYDYGHPPGVSTGWDLLDSLMTLHKGCTYLFTGIPSHGKTSLIMAMMMNAVGKTGVNWKGAVFSPEYGTTKTALTKLVQLSLGRNVLPGKSNRASREEFIAGMEWVSQRIWMIDAAVSDGAAYATLGLEEILRRAERKHLRDGLDFLILDPWNRIDAARPRHMTETEYVAFAMNAIGRFARRHNILVLIVAHPTKQDVGRSGQNEEMPNPYAIAGSGHWYAMSDFIVAVHRKKWSKDPEDPDLGITTVRTWKVREEGDQGSLGSVQFTYDPDSRRFTERGITPATPGEDSFVGWLGSMNEPVALAAD